MEQQQKQKETHINKPQLFDKGYRQYNGTNTVFSINGLDNWMSTCKNKNLDANFISFTKVTQNHRSKCDVQN